MQQPTNVMSAPWPRVSTLNVAAAAAAASADNDDAGHGHELWQHRFAFNLLASGVNLRSFLGYGRKSYS